MKAKTILIDPPWNYSDKIIHSGGYIKYETMSLEDLAVLPLDEISEDESHLYLWTTTSFLDCVFDLITAWGFEYKTIIPWLKRYPNRSLWMGMGNYFRNCIEILVFATKNNKKLNNKETRNLIDAIKPDKHHSSKPEESYKLIESCSDPPYLEIFATQKRAGWYCLGNEIDQMDIFDSIELFYNEQIEIEPKLKIKKSYNKLM